MTKLMALKANLINATEESMAVTLIRENLNIENEEVLSNLLTEATYISSFKNGHLVGLIDKQIHECEEEH